MHHFHDPAPPADEPQQRRVARMTARTVPWAMGSLAASMREHGEGLHPAQFRMLMWMQHGGGITPSDLADRMEVSLPTASSSVAVLERHGWVARAADESDRRRVVLTITDAGRAVVRRAMDGGVDQLANAFASATAGELDAIEAGMEALQEVLRRAHADHPRRGCRHGHAHAGEDAR